MKFHIIFILIWAVPLECMDLINGASTKVRDISPHNLDRELVLAVRSEEVTRVEELIANPAININWAERGETVLHQAFDCGSWQSAYLLSELSDLDPNKLTKNNAHPIGTLINSRWNMSLSEKSQNLLTSIIFNLVERGIMVEGFQENECLSDYLNRGDMLHEEFIGQFWPLMRAFGGARVEALAELPITDFPDDNSQDCLAVLLWKETFEELEDIESCIARGAGLNTPDRYTSLTPCMIIASQGDTWLFEDLVNKYSSLLHFNARGCNDWHMLHFASYNGHGKMVKLLLSQSAIDAHPLTRTGHTPYSLAMIGEQVRVAAKLEKGNASEVLKKFIRYRWELMKCFHLLKKSGVCFPKDIIDLIVRSYRLSEPLKSSDYGM